MVAWVSFMQHKRGQQVGWQTAKVIPKVQETLLFLMLPACPLWGVVNSRGWLTLIYYLKPRIKRMSYT